MYVLVLLLRRYWLNCVVDPVWSTLATRSNKAKHGVMQGKYFAQSAIVISHSYYIAGSISVFQETSIDGGRVWKKCTKIGTKYGRSIRYQRRKSWARKISLTTIIYTLTLPKGRL
jgi:hypothetical protein